MPLIENNRTIFFITLAYQFVKCILNPIDKAHKLCKSPASNAPLNHNNHILKNKISVKRVSFSQVELNIMI